MMFSMIAIKKKHIDVPPIKKNYIYRDTVHATPFLKILYLPIPLFFYYMHWFLDM